MTSTARPASIARNIVEDFDGNTLVNYYGSDIASGFTLERVYLGWRVSDGNAAVIIADPAEALRTYAEYLETFADDLDSIYAAEAASARKDADYFDRAL